MLIAYLGLTHLGQTLRAAAKAHGMKTINLEEPGQPRPDLIFLTRDVETPRDEDKIRKDINFIIADLPYSLIDIPVVIVSQVGPGFARKARAKLSSIVKLYTQVDTLIMDRAMDRAMNPEQIIIGCEDFKADLPAAYANYCLAFGCPIIKMSYESAEFAKLAINFHLAAQVKTAIELSEAAETTGADWTAVSRAMKGDARIGPKSYLEPGPVIGGHIPRDVRRINDILVSSRFAAEIENACEEEKE